VKIETFISVAYFLNVMKTVQYELRSQQGFFVDVPADYAEKAESLVDLVLQNPMLLLTDTESAVTEHPYLGNPGILAKVASLATAEQGTMLSLILQDEVYLKVCIYGIQEMEASDLIELERMLRS